MALTKQISSRALILSPTTAEVATTQTISPYYDFRLNGVLEIPIEGHFDGGRYINAAQKFLSAKISVRKGGTSEYDIAVKSYDSMGGDEITHIDFTGLAVTTNNSITTLPFLQDAIAAERTIVFSIFESSSGTPVEDFCLTIVSSLFADLTNLDEVPVVSLTGPSLTNTQVFSLLSGRALAITSGGVDYASADDIPTAGASIGIATSTAAPAGPVNLVGSGLASNVLTGLGFVAGDRVFLGIEGNLVDEATASSYPVGYAIKQLGFAVNATDMWVQIAKTEIIA